MNIKSSIGVIKIEGGEARKFLHAIVSSDIQNLEVGHSQQTLLLTPVGKLDVAFWVYCLSPNAFLAVCDKAVVTKLQENLQKFLIRTKAEIKDLSCEFSAFVGFEVDKEEVATNHIVVEHNYLGVDSLKMGICQENDFQSDESNRAALEALRICFGGVSNSAELSEQIIPQEANLDKLAISFSKGCFLGQELVCRIDSRQSATPFSFFAVTIENPSDLESIAVENVEFLVNSELGGQVVSILELNEGSRVLMTVAGIKTGQFHAIVKVPRKIAELLRNELFEGDVEIVGQDENATRCNVVNWQKVSGSFSI